MYLFTLLTATLLTIANFSTERAFTLDNSGASPSIGRCSTDTSRPIPIDTLEEEEIIFVQEEMPRFPGCEHLPTPNEKKHCADQKLLHYIYSNIHYSCTMRESQIEGMVVISFTVTTQGKIADIKILRDPGAGLGEDAARVVASMNDLPEPWISGKALNGQAVAVCYNLPIRYKLN